MRHITFFLILLSVISSTFASNNVEHILWDKTPIKFTIPIGTERRIDFPVSVEIQAPRRIIEASKPIQNREDGSIYWTANEAFDTTRIKILTTTGYSYLVDITAKEGAPTHPIVILDDRMPKNNTTLSKKKNYNYDYVDITQMAMKNIYAPIRLTRILPGVTKQSVPNHAHPLYRGGDVITEPMTQWKSPSIPTFYVTAVRVTSNSLNETVFDPRLLRGDFLAASAQHPVIYPVGNEGSTTTWYLVSANPFIEAAP